MSDFGARSSRKAATAARMYDYYLGGVHNFVADREAADAVIERFPFIPEAARANRAFVVNAVRHLSESGIRQFLDIGSGIPTVDNVHSVARRIHPDTRVAYVDIDPVAVAESMEILEGDGLAVAVRGDVREPRAVVGHSEVRRLLDFDQPVGVIVAAVLHFVPEHQAADDAVAELIGSVASGSHFVVSHSATESFRLFTATEDVYQRRTSTPGTVRTREEVERLFTGLELLDPGVVWAQEWRPGVAVERVESPRAGGIWAGVGRKA
ncbi:SAM-dependent methyltransferase [Actinoplanes sp. NPDC051411]|uniref:SAM-dependent methyltransferase n=1 Tax=Actinoplanes sp. NPDC051411 TaxID=3155522 RepID=UPI00344A9BE3